MAETRAAPSTRVPLIVAIVLVLALAVGGAVAGKKKTSKKGSAPPGSRAVIVPAGGPLTFVIPPCGTGKTIRPGEADRQRDVKGAAVFQLPARPSLRTVQVPPCGTQAGTPPAAAFVLQGSRGGRRAGAQLRLEVPTGSTAKTLVVPPCTRKGKRGTVVLPPPAGGSTAALAPSC